MRRVSLKLGALGAVAIVAALVVPAGGASVSLPTEIIASGVNWGYAANNDGFYNEGDPCDIVDTETAFVMGDAALVPAGGQEDAFDDAGAIRLDGSTEYFTAPPGGLAAPVDLTGTTLTTGTGTLGPLNVSVQWHALTSSPTIRELVTIQNPTAADVTRRVRMDFDFGSDNDTNLWASSSGDLTWTAADRWVVTDDSPDTDLPEEPDNTDPAIVSVLFGPGTVASPAVVLDNCNDVPPEPADLVAESKPDDVTEPTSATTDESDESAETTPPAVDDVSAQEVLLPDCQGEAVPDPEDSCDTWSVGFDVTVPAGATRYLMFFWQLHENPDGTVVTTGEVAAAATGGAVAAAQPFNTTPAADSDLVAGVDPAVLPLIVNWAFPLTGGFTG